MGASIGHNYVVGADKVTRKQVTEAQAILDSLVGMIHKGMDMTAFNQILVDLYQIIPRRMVSVREHLIEDITNLKSIEEKLAGEQATLDVMRGQVEMNQKEQTKTPIEAARPSNLLDTMGLEMDVLTDASAIKLIKKMMGDDSEKFSKAFAVVNHRTEKRFQEYVARSRRPDTKLFWHGSRNENWLSILKNSLVLRPANAVISGKMFGYGLYFADKCRKSLNYTSLSGSYWASGSSKVAYMAIYEVHTGKQLKIQRHESWCTQLTADTLKQHGKDCDSVFAQGGFDLVNNEYIVYDESQCTIKYLVEIKS